MAECSSRAGTEEVKVAANEQQDPEISSDQEEGGSEEGEIVRGKDDEVHQQRYVFADHAICQLCVLKEDAIAYCKQCECVLCDDCLGYHKNLRDKKDHEIEESPKIEEVRRKLKCHTHNQYLDYFCEDCESPICQNCFLTECVNHKKSLPKDVREEIMALLNGVQANATAFREHAEFIRKVMIDSEEAVLCCTDDVNQVFGNVIRELEEKKASILSLLKEKTTENIRKNEEQKEHITKIIDGMEKTSKDADNLLQTRKDSKLMVNKIMTCANLEARVMQSWDKKFAVYQSWQLEHMGEKEYATRFCQLVPKPRPRDITVGGLVSQEARVGVTNTFTVAVNNFMDQLQAFDEQTANNFLSIKVLFEHNDCPGTSTTVRHRSQREEEKWTVTYFLRAHGTVTIFLFMCGDEIENQPFTLQTNPSRVELSVGDRVVRGPDWEWDNQDGGAGKEGVVTKIKARGGWVTVQWDHNPNSKKNDYRWGNDECYDLKVIASARDS